MDVSQDTIWLAIIVLALLGYPLSMRFFASLVHARRLEMADLGRELLASDSLSKGQIKMVEGMLDDAFDWKVMPVITWFVFLESLRILFLGKLRISTVDGSPIIELMKKERFRRFMDIFPQSIMAANPLFTLVFYFVLPLLVFSLIVRGTMSRTSEALEGSFFAAAKHT